jgi:hypothetical protein
MPRGWRSVPRQCHALDAAQIPAPARLAAWQMRDLVAISVWKLMSNARLDDLRVRAPSCERPCPKTTVPSESHRHQVERSRAVDEGAIEERLPSLPGNLRGRRDRRPRTGVLVFDADDKPEATVSASERRRQVTATRFAFGLPLFQYRTPWCSYRSVRRASEGER